MIAQDLIWATLTIICWSMVSTFFRLALQSWQPLALCFYAVVISCCIFGIWSLFQKINPVQNLKYSLALGLLNPALYYWVLLSAYQKLPGPLAQGLNYLWPLWLTLFYFIANSKKLHRHSFIGLSIALVGGQLLIYFNARPSGDSSLTGIALALSSGLLWASYWHLQIRDPRPLPAKLFGNFLIGGLGLGALALFTQTSLIWPNDWTMVVPVALFEMALPFIFWTKAMSSTQRLATLNALLYCIPFLALIPLHFWAKDPVSIYSPLALILIIYGSFLSRKTQAQKT